MKVAIITANTDIYKGTKANESGEAVKLVAEEAGLEVVFMRALPLDREVLSAIMKRLADGKAAEICRPPHATNTEISSCPAIFSIQSRSHRSSAMPSRHISTAPARITHSWLLFSNSPVVNAMRLE